MRTKREKADQRETESHRLDSMRRGYQIKYLEARIRDLETELSVAQSQLAHERANELKEGKG